MKKFLLIATLFALASCANNKVDTIIHHAVIYTVDSSFTMAEAMAIKDGKIVATGKNDEILKKYNVEIIENIKGNFEFDYVEAYAHEDGNCGVNVNYGDTIFIAYEKSPNKPYLSICNSTSLHRSNDFLSRLETYIKSPKESQKPLVLSEFTSMFSDNELQGFVNYKTKIVEDKYVTLWFLTNYKKTKEKLDYKSFKSQIKISCEHKKYNVNSIYYYTETNATGKLVDISENEAEKFYEWKEINKEYPLAKVMRKVCAV